MAKRENPVILVALWRQYNPENPAILAEIGRAGEPKNHHQYPPWCHHGQYLTDTD